MEQENFKKTEKKVIHQRLAKPVKNNEKKYVLYDENANCNGCH